MPCGLLQDVLEDALAVGREGLLSPGEVPVVQGHELAVRPGVLHPELVELGRELVPDRPHRLQDPGLVVGPHLRIRGVGEVGEVVQDQVLEHRAHIVPHGPEEGEFWVDDPGVLLVEHDGAGVQVRVDQGLRVVHVGVLQLGDRHLQDRVRAHGLDLVVHQGVPVVLLGFLVGVGVDEVLLELAQLLVDELGLEQFLLRAGEVVVRGEVEGAGQEGGDVVREVGELLPGHHGLAHDLVGPQVFHGDGCHLLVEVVELRRQPRGVAVVFLQGLGLVAGPGLGQGPGLAQHPQVGQGLLDDHGVGWIRLVLHHEDEVEIAVPHLADGHRGVRWEEVRQGRALSNVVQDVGLVEWVEGHGKLLFLTPLSEMSGF